MRPALLSLALVLPLSLSLVACGDKDGGDSGDPSPAGDGGGDGDTGTDDSGTGGSGDTGSDGSGDTGTDGGGGPVDEDGDGHVSVDDGGDDCDDGDPDVHPEAEEVCDEVDNDCDGEIDEDVLGTFFVDEDGDGFGDPDREALACAEGEGLVADATDCDDTAPTTFPGAEELSCDGVDNDCDEGIDEDSTFVPTDHATLQEAVDALADGAEICVEAGTWVEQLDLSGRTLRFVGQAGAAGTVLDVGTAAPMITITGESETYGAGDVSFRGFTITSGELTTDGADVLGGFAHVDGGTLSLSQIEVVDMSGTMADEHVLEGLLVYGVDSSLHLDDVAVDGVDLQLTGTASSTSIGLAGGIVRAVRGELSIDDMRVADLDLRGDADRSGCRAWGAVLAADDNGRMGAANSDLEGTVLSVAGLEVRDSTVSLACQDSAYTGSLIELENTSGEVVGLQLTDNSVEASAASRAYTNPLLHTWYAADDAVFSVLDVSGNTVRGDAENGGLGGAVEVAGAEVSHVDVWGNAFEFSGASGRMAWLVKAEAADSAHLDVRGNTVDVTSTASPLVEVYPEERDGALRNFVIAGNEVQAGQFYGLALDAGVLEGTLTVRNGDIVGNHFEGPISYSDQGLLQGGGEEDGDLVDVASVQIVDNTYTGDEELWAVTNWWDESFSLSYSNLYGNPSDETGWGDVVGTDGIISADPLYTDVSGDDPTTWDLTLSEGSPAVDAGDPALEDADGTTSDMGAFGGPGGGW